MKSQYRQGFTFTQMPTVELSKYSGHLSRAEQPPVSRGHLRAQLARLVQEAANTAAARKDQPAESPNAQTAKSTRQQIDYAALIQAWFASMPPAVRQRRYQIEEFIVRFPGVYRERSSPKVIGAALRSLGWEQKRDWSRAGRNRRYWVPPKEQKQQSEVRDGMETAIR